MQGLLQRLEELCYQNWENLLTEHKGLYMINTKI